MLWYKHEKFIKEFTPLLKVFKVSKLTNNLCDIAYSALSLRFWSVAPGAQEPGHS